MKPLLWIINLALVIVLATLAVTFLLLSKVCGWVKDHSAAALAHKVAKSLDQSCNAALDGNEDHTVSGRIGWRIEMGHATWPERAIAWMLDKIDKDHCAKSIEYDEVRHG